MNAGDRVKINFLGDTILGVIRNADGKLCDVIGDDGFIYPRLGLEKRVGYGYVIEAMGEKTQHPHIIEEKVKPEEPAPITISPRIPAKSPSEEFFS